MRRLAIAPCILVLLPYFSGFGAEPIGVVFSGERVELEGNLVSGGATLFEGNLVSSLGAGAELRLRSGARVVLETESKVRVYAKRLVLERGAGEVEIGPEFQVEARGLRLSAESGPAMARLALTGASKLQAAVDSGLVRVASPGGFLVARMRPGMSLEFEPQQTAPGVEPPFEMTGCLERRNGRFILSDPVSGVVEEVRGEGLEREAGNAVEVTARLVAGAKPTVEGASEVIQILRLRRVSRGCPAVTAPQPGGPGKPGAPAPTTAPLPETAGMSAGKKAVIAGVVVGGAGAGAAVILLKKKEEKGTISP